MFSRVIEKQEKERRETLFDRRFLLSIVSIPTTGRLLVALAVALAVAAGTHRNRGLVPGTRRGLVGGESGRERVESG